jgi:CubicO group peptidase (beta-lactamase class C family)
MLLRSAARIASVLVLLLGVPQLARAQQTPSDSAVRAMLKKWVDAGQARGVVVGILQNGQRRYIAYGSAGPGRLPLGEHTVFEIGSVSKTFTSLLLAESVVRGEAQLDEPVVKLLPSGAVVPSFNGRQITLQDLATHRSGLPRLPGNFAPRDSANPYVDYDASRLLAFLRSYKLPRAPGDSAEYSNLGAGLLGYALVNHEKAKSWGALVHDRITAPLGMHETFVDVPATARNRVSAGHNAQMDSVPAWYWDALAGAGALRSTASDMLTYLAAELDTTRGPLARAVAVGRKPRAAFLPGNRIALAWLVRGNADHPVWWHNGETFGFSSFAAFDPARKLAIVVLSNATIPVDRIGAQILEPVVQRKFITLPAAALDRLVGKYALAPTFVLSVTREGDALYVQATGQPRFPLSPEAPDKFYAENVDAELVFTLGPTGKATSVTLRQNGTEHVAKRQP